MQLKKNITEENQLEEIRWLSLSLNEKHDADYTIYQCKQELFNKQTEKHKLFVNCLLPRSITAIKE